MKKWRSWGDGHSGPIVTQWNVNSFPTIYIIDHKGITRFRGTLDPDFVERAVESLLAEAESGKKGAARKRPG